MGLYLEDDDELRKMRDRFAQSTPAGAAASGNPYGAPPRELDPSTVQSFLAQRPDDSRNYAYPIPQRESGPGVADWFPLAAAGLDLAFNRGRGMGSIAQSAAGMAQRRDAMAQQQFEDDRSAYLKQGEAAARDRQVDISGRNADMRQMELDASLAKEKAIQARFLAGEGSPEAQAADLRYKQALAAKAEADAARDPNALDPYKQQLIEESKARTESLRNPQAKADSPELAYRKKRDEQEDATKKKKAEDDAAEQKALRTPFAGIKVGNDDLWGAGVGDKVQRRRLADGVAAYQSAMRALTRMQEIRGDVGTEATDSAPAAEYNTLKNEAMAAIGVAANAGVLQPSDIDRFKAQIPEIGPKLADSLRLFGQDTTLESLKGTQDALRGSANVKSKTYGFDYDYSDPVYMTDRQLEAYQKALLERQKTTANAPDDALPPDRISGPVTNYKGRAPDFTNVPDDQLPRIDLGTTGQKRSEVPKVNDYLRRLKDEDDDLGVVYR